MGWWQWCSQGISKHAQVKVRIVSFKIKTSLGRSHERVTAPCLHWHYVWLCTQGKCLPMTKVMPTMPISPWAIAQQTVLHRPPRRPLFKERRGNHKNDRRNRGCTYHLRSSYLFKRLLKIIIAAWGISIAIEDRVISSFRQELLPDITGTTALIPRSSSCTSMRSQPQPSNTEIWCCSSTGNERKYERWG